MPQSLAYLPNRLDTIADVRTRVASNIFVVLGGTILISLLAQIAIPLPWTPVPITGQTFGVALVAMLLGRNRGGLSVLLYLFAGGVLGLPIFAKGGSGIMFSTFGYLIGMVLASAVMGTLADKGWAKSFSRAYLSILLGSAVTFSCGLIVLSSFVPREALLSAGLWPFLLGDFVKSVSAAWIVSRFSSKN